MATSNNRDVRLGVAVETTGEDSLRGLAGDFRGVGAEGAAAAAKLAELTSELSRQETATKELREAEGAARAEQQAARRELETQRDALARLRAESTAATRSTDEFQAAERAAKLAIVDSRAALRERAAAVRAAADETKASLAAEKSLAEALDRTRAAQRAAAAAAREQANAVGSAFDDIRSKLNAVANAALAVTGGSIVASWAKDVANVADGYANLAARVKIAAGEQGNFAGALQGVFDVAQRTGVAVEETGALYTKLSQAGKDLNLTSADALRLAESVSQATQISGASAQEAAAAVTQFAQAVASGVLQGDELRSLLENSPRLAQALAEGLGTTVGKLKELGAAGALTSQQVIAALQGQSQALQREFDQLPPTVGRALTQLSNAWTQYIGEADKGTGASHTAAAAISALAANLDVAIGALWSAGKAAAALAAIRLASSLIESATAARTVATATAAATTAIEANTVAQVANAAATAGSVATVGRFAAVLGSLKLFSLVGVLTNLKEIGTWLGETAAKLAGYGDQLEELERAQRADAEAARAWAAQTAALAQQQQAAADKAFGLTTETKKLVGEFESARAKGDSLAEAMGKVAKSFDLGNVRGITQAITALDALGQRAGVAGEQIRTALGDALKGVDLATFETQARAAFDSSEQGARRLQIVLDAIADESLKRAGTSVDELRTGFSRAATSAINDVDALSKTLRDLGVTGADAGRALAASLDKATTAAGTERAVQAVIDRIIELGKAGLLSGDQLTGALDKARRKLDDIGLGVNSLAEAFHNFGLQSREELQATADKLGASWQRIANDGTVSVGTLIEAFGEYYTAALAANGGVESSALKVQRKIVEMRADAAGLGDALAAAMKKAETATNSAYDALTRYAGGLSAIDGLNGAPGVRNADQGTANDLLGGRLSGEWGDGTQSLYSQRGQVTTSQGSQLVPPDNSGNWTFVNDNRVSSVDPRTGSNVRGYWLNSQTGQRVTAGAAVNASGLNGSAPAPAPTPTATPSAAPAPRPTAQQTVRVELSVAGQGSYPVTTDEQTAAALVRGLNEAKRKAGYS